MSTAPTTTTRERILDAAVAETVESGWSGVTMGRLASAVGVSRQTVYNEVGHKEALAEAMILAELERFLGVVDRAFSDHQGSLVAAIRAACHDVLVFARDNRLMHAIVSATHGADTELLPLLTTHADSLLDSAKAVVLQHLEDYEVTIPAEHRDAAVDAVVRVVLSHVMEPSGDPAATADGIAWIAGRALDGD